MKKSSARIARSSAAREALVYSSDQRDLPRIPICGSLPRFSDWISACAGMTRCNPVTPAKPAPDADPGAGLHLGLLSLSLRRNDKKAINRSFPNRSGGFTLLEVLVSLLILSVGLLGIAGLQLTGLRNNQSAYVRSQATILAYDILDRMRANRAEAQTGGYNITIQGTGDLPSTSGSPTQAATDLHRWGADLLALLPAAQTSVNVAANNTVTVSIVWDDSRADQASDRSGAPVTDATQFQFQTEL